MTLTDTPAQQFVVDGVVTDRLDGTYRVVYELKRSGPHMMSVVLLTGMMGSEELHIKGSPFKVQALIGPVTAHTCRVSGDGLTSARIDERASFKLVRTHARTHAHARTASTHTGGT